MSRMNARRSTSDSGAASGTGASYYRVGARPAAGRDGFRLVVDSERLTIDVALVAGVPVPHLCLPETPAEIDRAPLAGGGKVDQPGGSVAEHDPVALQEFHLPRHPVSRSQNGRRCRAAP